MSTSYSYKPQQKKAVALPIQLQSVQTNDLYNRRNRTKSVCQRGGSDGEIYEDDRFPTIPDEFTPTRTIKTPPSFIKMIGTTKVTNVVLKTHSIGV